MQLAGYTLPPSKGYHFPDSPSVDYIGVIPAGERQPLIENLNRICQDLIQSDIPTEIRYTDSDNPVRWHSKIERHMLTNTVLHRPHPETEFVWSQLLALSVVAGVRTWKELEKSNT